MRAQKLLFFILLVILSPLPATISAVEAQETRAPRAAELFFAPQSGSFQEGSTFEVPIFINTKGNNINAIELNIRFDPKKLSIVNPSGGKSIIGHSVCPR